MDKEFLQDLFSPFGEVTIKRMFGGLGVFHQGLSFAAVMDGILRLKADAETIPEFEAEGMGPFHYTRQNGTTTSMAYYQVPEHLLDDPDEFRSWAEKAFEAAVRADEAKPSKQQKRLRIL